MIVLEKFLGESQYYHKEIFNLALRNEEQRELGLEAFQQTGMAFALVSS